MSALPASVARAQVLAEEAPIRTAAEIAAAVDSLRWSVANSMRNGESSVMAVDASTRPEEISRELAPPSWDSVRAGHLRVSVLLAAINRDIRRGDPTRIEAWKQLLFGGVTEISVEPVAIVRFTRNGRQFQLLGEAPARQARF